MMDVFLSIVTCVKLVGTNLQLIAWGDGSQVPTSGNDLVIVGIDNIRLLHIRIFDSGGNLITDTDETKLPATKQDADEYVRVHPPQTWRATGSGGVPLACTRVIVAK